MMHPITIIGCGPGAPEYLSNEAVKAIESQSFVCGYARLLSLISAHQSSVTVLKGNTDESLLQIENLARQGSTGVLVSGNPNIFSLAKHVQKKFGAQVRRVVPGISAGDIALKEIGVIAKNVHFVSLHGGEMKRVSTSPLPPFSTEEGLFSKCAGSSPTLYFMGGVKSYAWLSAHAHKKSNDANWFWCEDLTLNTQQITPIEPNDIDPKKPSPEGCGLVIIAEIPKQGRTP